MLAKLFAFCIPSCGAYYYIKQLKVKLKVFICKLQYLGFLFIRSDMKTKYSGGRKTGNQLIIGDMIGIRRQDTKYTALLTNNMLI